VRGDDIDSQRFEQLVERGRLLLAAGEFDRAVVGFGRALELWRGTPFELLESWPPGQIAAARLGELRRTAEESLIEARLHLGEHRDVVPIAEARVAEEPLREHRWALLALALYYAGASFSPDGMELAVDTEQGIVVWDLDPEHWVAAACGIAGRNLTEFEWEQYIGDLAPYRATCPQFAVA
jgi:hypothetical protein